MAIDMNDDAGSGYFVRILRKCDQSGPLYKVAKTTLAQWSLLWKILPSYIHRDFDLELKWCLFVVWVFNEFAVFHYVLVAFDPLSHSVLQVVCSRTIIAIVFF